MWPVVLPVEITNRRAVRILTPASLIDLYPAFDLLEQGHAVLLRAADSTESPILPLTSPKGAQVGLFSSGTTGSPKLIWHAWPDLKSEMRRTDPDFLWGTPFSPWTYAGIQVAVQAWCQGQPLVTLTSSFLGSWERIKKSSVNAISCTPTFLDLLIQHEPKSCDWHPKQITLGGEPIRQPVAERLKSRFPHSRFTLIYASSEFGVLLKSHDLSGTYDPDYLGRRFHWRIEAGLLEIFWGGRWQTTGDLVALEDGRLRILGRAGEVANIAGSKVNLGQITKLAENVPGIEQAVAVAQPNSISGQVICLRYAVSRGAPSDQVTRTLQEHLRRELPRQAWPRNWELCDVTIGPNVKSALK